MTHRTLKMLIVGRLVCASPRSSEVAGVALAAFGMVACLALNGMSFMFLAKATGGAEIAANRIDHLRATSKCCSVLEPGRQTI
jgi:hypothetical protein